MASNYVDSLEPSERAKIQQSPGRKIFKFGGGEQLESKSCLSIPAVLAGKTVTIKTDLVDSDIPLLLSKDSMKRARIKLDLENDTAEVLGVPVSGGSRI